MTPGNNLGIFKINVSVLFVFFVSNNLILLGEQGMVQWWEHSPPTNVARVQIPASNVLCGLSLLLVLSFAPRGFSPGTPVFPSPQKPTFPNSNSTRNQEDEEPLCGCATFKSLFIVYLFIYLFMCANTSRWLWDFFVSVITLDFQIPLLAQDSFFDKGKRVITLQRFNHY